MLIARTDARGVTNYDDAVRRAHAYLEAGADAIFPEALQTEEELKRFADDVDTILLANMTEYGKTPYLSIEQFGELGYSIVIFPVTLQRIAMKAMDDALLELRDERTQENILADMQTREELYDLLQYRPR